MQELTVGVNWVAVVVGAVAAFVVGALWYSPSLFGNKWRQGLGNGAYTWPMGLALLGQAIACFLFAWVLALIYPQSLGLAILVSLLLAGATKANGLFSGKSRYAIVTESGYVVAQAVVILLALHYIK